MKESAEAMQSRALSAVSAPARAQRPGEPGILAAVDLGSNSFHMVVARLTHGQLTVVDRLREMVRLAAGLNDHNELDKESRERALECLSRFGERIGAMRADRVRVVGTNTLRKARRSGEFLDAAEELLGHPVEIISGIEEARLIYLGASHGMPLADGPQIVVDIGGGSTEIVCGEGYEPRDLESLYVGCVGISKRFFSGQKLTARRFQRARMAARLELEPVKARFRSANARSWAGCSGTIRAAQSVIRGFEGEDADITVPALEHVIEKIIEAGRLDRLSLPGLSDQRKPVFPGGIAILIEVMSSLGMERMKVSDGALREGILHDMVGRLTDEDSRVRTVRAMAARFHVDTAQAERVETTASAFLDQVADRWELTDDAHGQLLSWACRLHEMGLDIAHAHYHRHGAYLLEHADMPGFPRQEQRILASLVGSHRRGFSRKGFQDVPKSRQREVMRLAVLLRLAVLFNRSRTALDLKGVRLWAGHRKLAIQFPADWSQANPLTLADLERELKNLANAGVSLTLEVVEPER